MLVQSYPLDSKSSRQHPYQNLLHHSENQFWSQPSTTTQHFNDINNDFSFTTTVAAQSLFDFQPQNLRIQVQPELMQSEHNSSWLSNGQLTPTSATPRAHHHRESSLSSLGSAGPASPYNPNTSNPQVALSTDPVDIYYDMHDHSQYHHPASTKPLTPAHTPSQENFLTSQYSRFNTHSFHNDFNSDYSHVATMNSDGLPRHQAMGDAELMPAPDFSHSGRPSVVSVANHESPATPPSFDEERRKTGENSFVDFWLNEYLQLCDSAEYRSTMPKLDRTMTDIYQDELYNPNFQITSVPPSRPGQSSTSISPAHNDIFSQRLQAANNQHLSSMAQTPLNHTSRERSPFRQGSPLAPSSNGFGSQKAPNMRLGTASGMREQQKAENDAMVLQQQLDRISPERATPKTISPKDVDLVYHENAEDASMPLFPKQEKPSPQQYRPHMHQSLRVQEPLELDDNASQQSYGSMATSRRESISAYSTSSQTTPQTSNNFNFAPPAIPGGIRQLPQQYPFISQSRRQLSNISNVAEEFPATLVSMDSSSSEYTPETSEIKKPARTAADSGTYTCTYHNCTLRFDTPAKLQRHKREGHRQPAAMIGGDDANDRIQNSQAGPHKCERINPSTGNPCNTIFSRPYDLTRHEDTIHNARKQKIRCNLCTEEKTFSRADALTRHYKVVHPEQVLPSKSRRRGGMD
jgi:protein RPN4